MALQPKLIYLARRHPRLTAAGFTARWRAHAALGMSLPRWRNIARYTHGDVRDPGPEAAGLARGYAAVGMIWHRSAEARAAHRADGSSREVMEQDELETFAEPIVHSMLIAREHRSIATDVDTAHGIRLVRFLSREMGVGEDGSATQGALQLAGVPLRGHVINWPLPPETSEGWGLHCAAVEELWFADERTARAAAQALSDAANGSSGPCVLTNEIILYEDERRCCSATA